MNRYPSYKPSGVKWLGEIPSHWEVIKSKYLWKESFSISENGNEELLSVSQYDGITPAKGDSRSESLKGYKIVSENDLVINIMLAWMGGLGVSKYDGIVSPAYCVYKLTKDSNPKYLHYLYKTPLYLAEFARHSSGVIPSRWRMYTDDFGQVISLLPPRKEQDAIVGYLDEKMAKIDAAIAQQQKMIDLLNERKQIIINRAVTKGLNPNAKMKDSGVEWIGEVPEGWFFLPGKSLYHENKVKNKNNEETNVLSLSYGKIIRKKELVEGLQPENYNSYQIVEPNYIIIRCTDLQNDHTSLRIGLVKERGIITGAYLGLIPHGNINPSYLHLFLHVFDITKEIYRYGSGTRQSLNWVDFKNLPILIPSPEEQESICKYVNDIEAKINKQVFIASNQISLLQERKQIIINEVVTGKVKVI